MPSVVNYGYVPLSHLGKHYYESGTARECPPPGEMPIERTTIYSETFPPTPLEKCIKEERL